MNLCLRDRCDAALLHLIEKSCQNHLSHVRSLIWYSFRASAKAVYPVWCEHKLNLSAYIFVVFRRKFGELLMKLPQKTFLGYLSTLTFEKRMATKHHGSDSIQRMLSIKLFKQSCTLQLLIMNFTLALHHCLRLQNKF